MTEPIRVRIAPSPTGSIHVGLARSALYNWLFARHNHGVFVLRIEDTDPSRSTEESGQAILDGFRRLGLDWDEGPFFQSQRFDVHRARVEELRAAGKAYYCYCTPEELEAKRQEYLRTKQTWRYDRHCLGLSAAERDRRAQAGMPRTVRFLVPDERVVFEDIIHGSIEKQPQDIEDFVLLRADGSPTYNCACTIDDHDMGISHVLRAVEHIANTPKQILLYRALGWSVPRFAHLPLLLGTDRKKISKRHGAVSLDEYERMGILPEALVNFLALLGWSPGGDRELMSRDEMVELFTLERVNRANAVFDLTKLEWMNGEYLRRLPAQDVRARLTPFLAADTIDAAVDDEYQLRLVDLLRVRTRRLTDLAEMARPFLSETFDYDPDAVAKHLTDEGTRRNLGRLADRLATQAEFSAGPLEQLVRAQADEAGLKAAALIHPTRVALFGRTVGPPLFDAIALLGRERTVSRLRRFAVPGQ